MDGLSITPCQVTLRKFPRAFPQAWSRQELSSPARNASSYCCPLPRSTSSQGLLWKVQAWGWSLSMGAIGAHPPPSMLAALAPWV